jgi:hypothetical protein
VSLLDEEHQYDVVPYEKFEDTKGVIRNRKYVTINKFTHIEPFALKIQETEQIVVCHGKTIL